MIRRIALLGFFLIAACGSIGSTNQAHAITLGYKSGDTYKYQFHAALDYTIGIQTMTVPVKADLSANEKITVKSVDSSGTADLNVDLTNLKIATTTNGTTNTTTTDTSQTVEMKVASDGRVISVNGSSVSSGSSLPGVNGTQGGLISAILPDKPVKVGDTWTKDFDESAPIGSGSVHATSTNKYTKDEKVGSVNAAVVDSNVNTTINLTIDSSSTGASGSPLIPAGSSSGIQGLKMNGTVASTVTSWVDTGAKRIVKTHQTDNIDATLDFTMAAGAQPNPLLSGPLTIKGTQTLDLTPA